MDALTIQARINRGNGIASRFLGIFTTVYRPSGPSGPTNPITPGNIVATLNASFNTSAKFDAVKPSDYPNPKFYGLFDRTLTLPGDYLVQGADTWFIASQDLNQSTLCIECNRVVRFGRPEPATVTTGLDTSYDGDTTADETALMTGWPASVLQGTKGERGTANLPADTRTPWVAILLPACAGVTLRSSDIMTDDFGRRFVVSSVELSALGYRITADQTET